MMGWACHFDVSAFIISKSSAESASIFALTSS